MKTLFAIGAALGLFAGGNAYACDKPVPVEAKKAQELEATIGKEGSSIARLAAFDELSCANRPEYRRAALEAAFKSTDKTLRSAALATAIFAREGIRIDMIEAGQTDATAKTFIKDKGGSLPYQFKYKDRANNCLSFANGRETCYPDTLFVIDGLSLRLTDKAQAYPIYGEFTLQPDNTLKGKLRREGTQPIDAKIDLL